jgi:hypothetical protein
MLAAFRLGGGAVSAAACHVHDTVSFSARLRSSRHRRRRSTGSSCVFANIDRSQSVVAQRGFE